MCIMGAGVHVCELIHMLTVWYRMNAASLDWASQELYQVRVYRSSC